MKRIVSVILTTVFVLGMGVATFAQDTPRVDKRERHQQRRIRQGVRSGELTRRETERLQAEEAKIRVDEAFARRSGGELTAKERARIERELNRASKDIYKQKHDEQERH